MEHILSLSYGKDSLACLKQKKKELFLLTENSAGVCYRCVRMIN